jgi:glycerol-3-phosphate acyltransferase PlsY
MLLALAVIVTAYLIGSVPWSFLVARAFGVADVRRVGSGNVGATNVLRGAGRPAAALALVLDVAKGALAVASAVRLAPGDPVLPVEFHAFGLGFPAWKPEDSVGWLLVMAWDLSMNWRTRFAPPGSQPRMTPGVEACAAKGVALDCTRATAKP